LHQDTTVLHIAPEFSINVGKPSERIVFSQQRHVNNPQASQVDAESEREGLQVP
jgi:hypothetical protein